MTRSREREKEIRFLAVEEAMETFLEIGKIVIVYLITYFKKILDKK